MNDMERFLSELPYLKHLELKSNALSDIANGYQWQNLTTSLITFHFKFNLSLTNIDVTLYSFRTPFWLEEKRWYVAFRNECLFSLPHFTPIQMDSRNLSDLHSTLPDHSVIFNLLKEFTITTDPFYNLPRLTHIKTLILDYPRSLKILESVIDLNQVEHLTLLSLDYLLIFLPLKCTMSQLYKLTIKNSLTIDVIKRIRSYRFEQILQLEISISDEHNDYIIEELFYLFPSIQHLIYKSSIQSKQTMIRFINGFQHLSNASFSVHSDRLSTFSQDIHSNLTCRIYYSSIINFYNIYWWIEERVSCIHRIKVYR
jgi:hypothetical protein